VIKRLSELEVLWFVASFATMQHRLFLL